MTEDRYYKFSSEDNVATITLSNTKNHNAFDDKLIADLTAIFNQINNDSDIKVVVLKAEGRIFSAGADLKWMKRMAGYDRDENLVDAKALAELLRLMNHLKKPLIGVVQGAAYGGGVGLAAVCDIVIASPKASFCLSEVRLGLVPAVISPYVVAAIGARAARRYFLTAENFDAKTAFDLGLVHELVEAEELQTKERELVELLLKNSPKAIAAAKQLITIVDRPIDDELIAKTANIICDIRASDEGREGLNAFLQKTKPNWLKPSGQQDNNKLEANSHKGEK